MPSITNIQENANQNHNELSTHPSQHGYHQKGAQKHKTTTNMLARTLKEGNSCWWESKLVKSWWKTVWRHLKKMKIEMSC